MHIFFSVGEPSGDQHAAHLIHELRRAEPDIRCSGLGGPLMEQAGCRLLFPMTDLAVMGIFAVIPLLGKFYRLLKQANRFFHESRPDAVVLIDFPGFNWWVARKAKAAGIPVFYYFPPQLWAWAPWRVRKIRKFVDHVLCSLPFEKSWYAQRGIEAEYVGHPVFDEVAAYSLDEHFCRQWVEHENANVAALPGSRNREVAANWPIMLDVIRRVSSGNADTRFLIACYKNAHRSWCQAQLTERDRDLPIHFFVNKTPEVLAVATCCLMVSGSVSLEVLARSKPAVVIYRVGRMMWLIAHVLLSCRFLSLPNLMAGRAIMPEFYCAWNRERDVAEISNILTRWLNRTEDLAATRAEMTQLRKRVVVPEATRRAAAAILERIGRAVSHRAA
jgi:lipid-A-disaccharide synthase